MWEQEVIRKLCSELGCTFIQASKNRGYNVGNNIGLRYAADKGYRYALVANPDMEFPEEDYLQRLMNMMLSDEAIAVCGSDIVTPEGIHQNPMKRDGDWHGSFGWVKDLVRRNKPADTYDFIDNYSENHYCSKVSGCCLLLRLDYLAALGYFDERVFLYCEEAILSRQVERAGKRMYYLADVQAVHRHIKSAKGDPRPRFRAWRRSRLYYIKNYSGDSWWGRFMASTSIRLYTGLLMVVSSLKRR
jgi:hypothetical protein